MQFRLYQAETVGNMNDGTTSALEFLMTITFSLENRRIAQHEIE